MTTKNTLIYSIILIIAVCFLVWRNYESKPISHTVSEKGTHAEKPASPAPPAPPRHAP